MGNGNGDGPRSQGRTFMWIFITAIVGLVLWYIENEIDDVENAHSREIEHMEQRIQRLESLFITEDNMPTPEGGSSQNDDP